MQMHKATQISTILSVANTIPVTFTTFNKNNSSIMGMQNDPFSSPAPPQVFMRSPEHFQALIFCEDDYLRRKRELTNIHAQKHSITQIWRLSSRVYDMGRRIEHYMTALRENFHKFDGTIMSGILTDQKPSDLNKSLTETLEIYSQIKRQLAQLIITYTVKLKQIIRELQHIYRSCTDALRNLDVYTSETYVDEFLRQIKEISLCKAEAYSCSTKTASFVRTIGFIEQKLE